MWDGMKLSIETYLGDLASTKPAPGGGSATALLGAMAVALCEKAMRISLKKDAEALERFLESTGKLSERFRSLQSEDEIAFQKVMTAYKQKLPSDRMNAILTEAARVPLAVIDTATNSMTEIQRFLPSCQAWVKSDLDIASAFLKAAVEASLLTARINLDGIQNDKDGYEALKLSIDSSRARVLSALQTNIS